MNRLDIIREKIIIEPAELSRHIASWNFRGKKIVFTNGCFDIIHRGHVEYLAQAANLGDVLILGLNSDVSVKKIKGNDRPVQDQDTRALVLAAMSFISAVVMFDEETPYNLIKIVQPDVLVKGGDYVPEQIVGYDVVKAKGGTVETIPFVQGHSTTGIIGKINTL